MLEGVLVVQRDPQVVPIVHKVVLGFAGHGDPLWTRCSRGGGGGGGKKEWRDPGEGTAGPDEAEARTRVVRWAAWVPGDGGGNPEQSRGPRGRGGADAAGASSSVAALWLPGGGQSARQEGAGGTEPQTGTPSEGRTVRSGARPGA